MNLYAKTKAGALQFVLFIGAVVALLLMAFMLLSHTHSHFDRQTDLVVSVIKAANYGLQASLDESIPLKNTMPIDYRTETGIDLRVERDLWGVFEKRTSVAEHGKLKQKKIALVGAGYSDIPPAVYLKDKQRPMIIAGGSLITGTAYLPEQGIKMGNIYGNSYHRERLVYGQRKISDSVLPRLGGELRQQITRLTDGQYIPEGEVLDHVPEKGLKNPFHSPTLILGGRFVRLKDTDLIGNIIVSASHKIVVEASTNLRDVLLLAPEVEIKNWVKGSFQVIASEKITVGKKCELYYPSALIVQRKKQDKILDENGKPIKNPGPMEPSIYLDSYAEVGGIVVALDHSDEPQYTPQIKIDDNARVNGEVYCTQNLELKGRVNGSVTTGSFIALENGSIYQNHLYNGSINSTHLYAGYGGLFLEGRNRDKRIMKWLY